MSSVQVRAALEMHLEALTPGFPTALENEDFTPPDGAYQRAHVLFAAPNNSESGPGFQEQGVFFVRLLYPPNEGWGAAYARAEAIRAHFHRGRTLDAGVVINRTPEIAPAEVDSGRYSLPIRIPFFQNTSA